MRVCDECKTTMNRSNVTTAITVKFSYGSQLFDGEEFELCSDRCFFKWGAKQAKRFLKLKEDAHAEMGDV